MLMNNVTLKELQNNLLFRGGEKFRALAPNVAIGILEKFLSHKNSELKLRALEKMCDYPGKRATSAFRDSLKHNRNLLVKISAIEGVQNLRLLILVPELKVALSDNSPMVRGYSAVALADLLGIRAMPHLSRALSSERSTWARAAIQLAIYMTGADNDVAKILIFLKSKQYRVRSFVINNLETICTKKNRQIIRGALRKQMDIETSLAVSSALKKVLRNI